MPANAGMTLWRQTGCLTLPSRGQVKGEVSLLRRQLLLPRPARIALHGPRYFVVILPCCSLDMIVQGLRPWTTGPGGRLADLQRDD